MSVEISAVNAQPPVAASPPVVASPTVSARGFMCVRRDGFHYCFYKEIDYPQFEAECKEYFGIKKGTNNFFGESYFFEPKVLEDSKEPQPQSNGETCLVCVDGRARTLKLACTREVYELLCEKGLFRRDIEVNDV